MGSQAARVAGAWSMEGLAERVFQTRRFGQSFKTLEDTGLRGKQVTIQVSLISSRSTLNPQLLQVAEDETYVRGWLLRQQDDLRLESGPDRKVILYLHGASDHRGKRHRSGRIIRIMLYNSHLHYCMLTIILSLLYINCSEWSCTKFY